MAVEGNRIRELRKKSGLTQEALGKKLGVIKQTVSSWENNISEPNSEILSKIAAIFNVSIDYILGNESKTAGKSTHHFFFFFDDMLKNTFMIRLKRAIENKGITISEFLNSSPLDKINAQLYLNGDHEPSLEDLIDISHYLETSIDYLLGQITEQENKYLQSFRQLNEDNMDIIIGDIKKYLKDQRRESVAADASLKQAK